MPLFFQLGLLLSVVSVTIQLIYNTNRTILNSYQINNVILHTVLMVKNIDHLQIWYIKKVKCTLVQALRLCTGRTAHRGSRGIALLFNDYGTRRWWGVGVTPPPLSTPGKDPVPIIREAGWAPGPVWTGAENLTPIRIFFFDPRTVQPVASRYIVYATRPTDMVHINAIM